jgi:phthalate 4,5-dioxygenase oxygenase subunit
MAAKSEEQELITRVSGAAPAARMMRRYWMPALWTDELPVPDGTPVRVRMFGENLVAFRDTSGAVGLLAEGCPHRLASLALGRNEEGGLRCIYHGWKFDLNGACVDMPTEPGEHGFRDRMRATSYPVREAGGIVWAYLGGAGEEPAFPNYDWTAVPRSHVAHLKFVENANYLQAVEGAIDSAHTRFLHRGTLDPHEEATRNAFSLDLAPRLEAVDTTYGFRYVAIRKPNVDADKIKYAKSTRFVMPTTAITSKPMESDHPSLTQIFVPIDDDHTMHYSIWHATNGKPLDELGLRRYYKLEPGVDLDARFRPRSSEDNWWNQDRAIMQNGDWSGISGLMTQDAACQESMGPIADRSQEHLGTSDVAIIRMRRRMLENVRGFVAGQAPIGLDAPIAYECLHSVPQLGIPVGEPWQNVDSYPGEFAAEPARAR